MLGVRKRLHPALAREGAGLMKADFTQIQQAVTSSYGREWSPDSDGSVVVKTTNGPGQWRCAQLCPLRRL